MLLNAFHVPLLIIYVLPFLCLLRRRGRGTFSLKTVNKTEIAI